MQSPEPEKPSSPRTRLARKSLTRIADRVTETGGDAGAPEVHKEAAEAAEVCNPQACFPVVDDEHEVTGNDLSSQLFREMRRRKSRGRASGGGGGGGGGLLGSPVPRPWLEPECFESPLTPSTTYYPLTPVKEQGETPHRVDGDIEEEDEEECAD